jgi:hypothetical protein
MEQRLEATYLRPGMVERATAFGIAALGMGTGILVAAWGISFLWRYMPAEIAVRIENPEVRVTQIAPLTVTQDKPFVFEQSKPLKIEPAELTVKVEPSAPSVANGIGAGDKTAAGDVISRAVTVFYEVKHGTGHVVTGWNYKDGSGGTPVRKYCYYAAPNVGHTSTRVDIASDGHPLPHIRASLLPDLAGALAKCLWKA